MVWYQKSGKIERKHNKVGHASAATARWLRQPSKGARGRVWGRFTAGWGGGALAYSPSQFGGQRAPKYQWNGTKWTPTRQSGTRRAGASRNHIQAAAGPGVSHFCLLRRRATPPPRPPRGREEGSPRPLPLKLLASTPPTHTSIDASRRQQQRQRFKCAQSRHRAMHTRGDAVLESTLRHTGSAPFTGCRRSLWRCQFP